MKNLKLLLVFCSLTLSFSSANAQETVLTQYQKDSLAVESYVLKIPYHLSDPVSIKMADTLFNMSEKIGNTRRQAVALSYIVDHYYLTKNVDSLFDAIKKVQKFSLENNQLIYYYFSWGRKITYYTITNRTNTAINELQLMQKDAIERGFYPAQVDANTLLARIYYQRNLYKEANELYAKAIQIIENAPEGVEITNIHSIYVGYATTFQSLGQHDDQKRNLDKAVEYVKREYQLASIYVSYCSYYMGIGDHEMAEKYLKMAKDLDMDRHTVASQKGLLQAELLLAKEKKQPQRMLRILNELKSQYHVETMWSHYAIAYELMDNYEKANSFWRKYIEVKDSLRIEDMRCDLSEMIVLMDVQKLKAESAKKELEMKSNMLMTTYILLSILVVALVILIFMVINFNKVNKQLILSDNNLKKAIVKMEEESRVKSEFLKHLSHEVRTPLNSIVGFSDIISEEVGDTEENVKYKKIIHDSSMQLIKLVNDAVDVSDYDRASTKSLTDVNTCFRASLGYMEIVVPKNVNLRFEPYDGEETKYLMEREKVEKILSNLIHNSSKFTSEGEIVVKADVNSEKKLIVYTVTDTGIGIPKEKRKYVFDYFSKLDPMSQGLGLGLSLSRLLAESMKGVLVIDESYSNGCRMILSFPYSDII